VKLATVSRHPYHHLDYIQELNFMKEKRNANQLEQMKENLAGEHEWSCLTRVEVSVSFFAILAAFDWTIGSYESLVFLKELNKKKSELNQLFGSKVIQKILLLKFDNVKWFGYILAVLYLAYLGFVTFYPQKWILLGWFVYFVIINIRLIPGLYTTTFTRFLWDLLDFWKSLDLMRIACLGFFIWITDDCNWDD
jgi:hypothetical protein